MLGKGDWACIRRLVLPLTTQITLNKSFSLLSLDFLICKFGSSNFLMELWGFNVIICVKGVIFRELYKIIIILRCYSSLSLGPTLHFPKIVNQGNESLMMGLGLTGKHFCEMGTFQQPIKLYQIGSLLFQMFIIFSYLPDLYSFLLGNTVRILKRVLIRRMLQRLTWNCFKSLLLFKEMCTE